MSSTCLRIILIPVWEEGIWLKGDRSFMLGKEGWCSNGEPGPDSHQNLKMSEPD